MRISDWSSDVCSSDLEVIALDGDDTLWHSEQLFVDTQEQFRKLVAPYIELDDETLDARLLQVERDNLPRFGYGVMAYTLSLIETAIDVTDGQIPGRDLQAVEIGRASCRERVCQYV